MSNAQPHEHVHHDHQHHEGHHTHVSLPTTGLKDPVCGMDVTEQSHHSTEHEGRPYYFCSAKCKARFMEAPQKFLSTPISERAPQPEPEAAQRAQPIPAPCTLRCNRTILEIAPSAA